MKNTSIDKANSFFCNFYSLQIGLNCIDIKKIQFSSLLPYKIYAENRQLERSNLYKMRNVENTEYQKKLNNF